MQLKLSDLEIEILRKLVNGEAVSISSQLRVRLELAGMIKEGPKGIVVTPIGRSLARAKPAEATASGVAHEIKVSRDSRGRRMPFQRKSIF
jgi:ribosomal protein S19E (S16A)